MDGFHLPCQLHLGDFRQLGLGPKALGALFHLHGQLKAVHALGEARVIVDDIGGAHLPAGGELLQNGHGKVGPGGVQGRGIASRPAAYHNHII